MTLLQQLFLIRIDPDAVTVRLPQYFRPGRQIIAAPVRTQLRDQLLSLAVGHQDIRGILRKNREGLPRRFERLPQEIGGDVGAAFVGVHFIARQQVKQRRFFSGEVTVLLAHLHIPV